MLLHGLLNTVYSSSCRSKKKVSQRSAAWKSMDTAERGRKSRFWRGVGICSTWHLFSSSAGTRTNVKLKKRGCVSGSAEVLMRRCNSWCSIKVSEIEKISKLSEVIKKDETRLQSWILFIGFLLNPREFLCPAVTKRFLIGMMWMLGFSPYYCKLIAKLFFTLQ